MTVRRFLRHSGLCLFLCYDSTDPLGKQKFLSLQYPVTVLNTIQAADGVYLVIPAIDPAADFQEGVTLTDGVALRGGGDCF